MLREAEKVKVDGQEEEGGGPEIAGSPAPRTSPAALPRGRLINVCLPDICGDCRAAGRTRLTKAIYETQPCFFDRGRCSEPYRRGGLGGHLQPEHRVAPALGPKLGIG